MSCHLIRRRCQQHHRHLLIIRSISQFQPLQITKPRARLSSRIRNAMRNWHFLATNLKARGINFRASRFNLRRLPQSTMQAETSNSTIKFNTRRWISRNKIISWIRLSQEPKLLSIIIDPHQSTCGNSSRSCYNKLIKAELMQVSFVGLINSVAFSKLKTRFALLSSGVDEKISPKWIMINWADQ